jgi:hypothetical protein
MRRCLANCQVISQQGRHLGVLTEAETLDLAYWQAIQPCVLKKLCNLDLRYGMPVYIAQVCQIDFPHSIWPDGFQAHGIWDMEHCKDT